MNSRTRESDNFTCEMGAAWTQGFSSPEHTFGSLCPKAGRCKAAPESGFPCILPTWARWARWLPLHYMYLAHAKFPYWIHWFLEWTYFWESWDTFTEIQSFQREHTPQQSSITLYVEMNMLAPLGPFCFFLMCSSHFLVITIIKTEMKMLAYLLSVCMDQRVF